jgi:SAM-dependent methyltransferase
MKFIYPGDSHRHSLQTLNQLYEYDDFMGSIRSMIDLGCGSGEDLIWWATRTTRDDNPEPLYIKCFGIDIQPKIKSDTNYSNIEITSGNFENTMVSHPDGFDVLWCHDAFQYALNPIQTLSNWWHIASPGAMLALAVPITQRIHYRQLAYELSSGCYYHHSMVSLMYMLATAGWDCGAGFFKQTVTEPWIHAVVYRSQHPPIEPNKANWHHLVELNLLPESAAASIYAHSALRQQDLIVPWVDHSLASMANL